MNIDKPRDIAPLRALWKQAFGDEDAFLDNFFALGFSEERCRCVYAEGRLAAAAYWFDVSQGEQRLAYLYAVATEEKFRGQGICHQLMAHIHDLLGQQGYDGVVLVPGSQSLFRFYSTMGYQTFGGMDTLQVCSGQNKVSLQSISKETYACMRKQYLPKGGVVQEGPMLSVLASQLQFYGAEGMVLCARTENAQAVILEYLGDAQKLPGVVAALGAQQASVRIPGEGPFAMYLPLCEAGKKGPAYFGLALD